MKHDWLAHYGIQGQKWGIRHGPPYPIRSHPRRVFISGTSKIKLKDSGFYRKSLPKPISDKLDDYISKKYHILIGDAPGIDTEVQKYLAKKKHRNVTVYTIEQEPRFFATKDLGWGVKVINGTEQTAKDKAMCKDAHAGFAITIENGASKTRKNIERMGKDGKPTIVFELKENGTDEWLA